ncbi:MAG: hypothetical protein OXC48_05920 [Endozoicomonadaceae bacterium]|nr:hypothetical protein [Endozoicomonadaceae bacterium]
MYDDFLTVTGQAKNFIAMEGMMHTFSRYLAVYFAWILGITETWLFLSTDQYWPLSFNDYLAIVLILWCARIARFQQGVVLLSASWAFAAGNFYALLLSAKVTTSFMTIQFIAMCIGLTVSVIGLLSSLLSGRRFFGSNKRTI